MDQAQGGVQQPAASHPTRHSTEGYSPRFLDVDSQICEELNGRLEVNAPNFVEKHFPVPSNIIDRIYRISTTSTPTVPDPVYSATRGGWRGLVEPAVYPDNVITITRLFKLIAYICTQDTGSTPIYWRLNPRPQQGPSVNAPVSSMRPTLAATTIKQDFGVVDYRRTHVVVEIDGEQAVKSGVERVMLVHLYQMLSLSPDRRFAFGITISKDAQMRIYMASRSGVVGSQLIDFNKDPKLVIQLIAGIQLASPSTLGWDTSMHMVSRVHLHAAVLGLQAASYNVLPCNDEDCCYTIVMGVSSNGNAYSAKYDSAERYILFERMHGTSNLIGNGSSIFKAWRVEDLKVDESERPTYIVKDSWYRKDESTENEILCGIESVAGIVRLRSRRKLLVDGERDSTKLALKRLAPTHTWTLWDDNEISEGTSNIPFNRVHDRLVLGSCGPTINKFKSHLELAQTMHDVVSGCIALNENNFIHRDINVNSIIITHSQTNPSYKSETSTDVLPPKRASGVLIDFGKAIWAAENDDPDHTVGTYAFVTSEIATGEFIFPPPPEMKLYYPTHCAIHDLEALLWVFLHLILSIIKPGGIVRPELLEDWDPESDFSVIWVNLFGCRECPRTWGKRDVFTNPELLDKILTHVTPFCTAFKNPVKAFYSVLREAYQTRDFTTVHAQVKDIFVKLEKTVGRTRFVYPGAQQAMLQEEKRRSEDSMNFPRSQFAFTISPRVNFRERREWAYMLPKRETQADPENAEAERPAKRRKIAGKDAKKATNKKTTTSKETKKATNKKSTTKAGAAKTRGRPKTSRK